jgi:hypothetical protein
LSTFVIQNTSRIAPASCEKRSSEIRAIACVFKTELRFCVASWVISRMRRTPMMAVTPIKARTTVRKIMSDAMGVATSDATIAIAVASTPGRAPPRYVAISTTGTTRMGQGSPYTSDAESISSGATTIANT